MTIAPPERTLTYAQLCELSAGRETRVELIGGEPFEMPSATRRHQQLLVRLLRELDRAATGAAAGRGQVYPAPLDVVLGPRDVLQPDLLVVLDEHREILQDIVRGVPDLVVEILSPGTAGRDRGTKLGVYARYGVPEVWLVDPSGRLTQYREPQGGTYRRVQALGTGDTATSALLPDLAVDLGRLFAS